MNLENACKKSRFKQAGYFTKEFFILAEWSVPGKWKISCGPTFTRFFADGKKEVIGYEEANSIVQRNWKPVAPNDY